MTNKTRALLHFSAAIASTIGFVAVAIIFSLGSEPHGLVLIFAVLTLIVLGALAISLALVGNTWWQWHCRDQRLLAQSQITPHYCGGHY